MMAITSTTPNLNATQSQISLNNSLVDNMQSYKHQGRQLKASNSVIHPRRMSASKK